MPLWAIGISHLLITGWLLYKKTPDPIDISPGNLENNPVAVF
jgi:hypothetical protein